MMIVRREDLARLHDPLAIQAEADRRTRERAIADAQLAAASKDAPGNPQWFVLAVANRSEVAVADSLDGGDIHVWLPMKQARYTRRRPRKSDPKMVPVFTGYVFVKCPASAAAFLGLMSVDGVRYLLGDGVHPLPVSDEIMNEVKMLVEGRVFEDDPRSEYRDGDRVEIEHGLFSFVTGVVKGYRGTRHVRCMAALFGGQVAINVPLENLKKIG